LLYPDLAPSVICRLLPDVPNPTFNDIFNCIIHPYDMQAFASLLDKHELTADYPNLITNLTHGFPIGRMPPITKTVILQNQFKSPEDVEAVYEYIKNEVESGQMSGPFS
jgi:hypothetical protein